MTNQAPKYYKNPTLATVLSFIITGLGQIYNGQIFKGVIIMVLFMVSVMLIYVGIGFITTPIIWIWGMVDANNSAKKINKNIAQS